MSFFKNLFSKTTAILELDLCISESSTCKIVSQTVNDDFHLMLTCLLVYGRVLKILSASKKAALTNFFIELPKPNKPPYMTMTIAEIIQLVTNTDSSSNSMTRVKLIQQPNGIYTIDVGTLYETDLSKYATLMFGFGLSKISESNRLNLLAGFATLSNIAAQKNLTFNESIIYPYDILDSLINDTE